MTKFHANGANGVLVRLKHARKERDFSIVPNSIYRDRRLDWSDLGMLTDLLHLPPEFPFSLQWLFNRRPSGKTATTAITQRLQAMGYMQCTAQRDPMGRVTQWLWEVSESPVEEWSRIYAQKIRRREVRDGLKAIENNPEVCFQLLAFSSSGESATKKPSTALEPSTTSKQSTTTTIELPVAGASTLATSPRF